MSSNQQKLESLASEIAACEECKENTVGKLVFGEGNPNAKIMFVGEAPGKQEAETGRPFIGRSGKLLREMIRSIGLEEKEVYITSPVKYLPKSGTPTKKQINHAQHYFQRQILIIDPEIIVLMGKTAVTAVLSKDIPILKAHGTVFDIDNRKIIITLHPAAVLRFPHKYKAMVIKDFKKISSLLSTP